MNTAVPRTPNNFIFFTKQLLKFKVKIVFFKFSDRFEKRLIERSQPLIYNLENVRK